MEAGVQFCDEGTPVEELAIEEVMIEKLLVNLKFLTLEELKQINAFFYEGKSEREYTDRLGVYHNAIHKRKKRIIKN